MAVNMIVCCKQVPDPEAPPAVFKVVNNKMTLPPEVKPVIGQYEEFALEAALKIKDTAGGKITALSLGNNFVRDVIKKSLAVGADELILLEDKAFEDGDSWSTANALAAAIKKIGTYDAIFCGRQSSDWDAGQVGLGPTSKAGQPPAPITITSMGGGARLRPPASGDPSIATRCPLPDSAMKLMPSPAQRTTHSITLLLAISAHRIKFEGSFQIAFAARNLLKNINLD